MSQDALQTLLDKQAIRDELSRYCRGLDRMDKEMARAVWHDDGTALYDGIFEGTGHGFIDWVWKAHAAMERHSHQITNVLIELDGDSARSEAYVTVALWTMPDGSGVQSELVGRGRYLDRWSRRDDRWAIEHRIHLLDMSTALEMVDPSKPDVPSAGLAGHRPITRAAVSPGASRDETDLSFRFIRKA